VLCWRDWLLVASEGLAGGLETCRRFGWLSNEAAAHRVLAAAWLERGGSDDTLIRSARRGTTTADSHEESIVFVIGIDPHKGSHTAAVIDDGEQVVGELRIDAGRRQADRLLGFAAPFRPRTWAVEAAGGLGALLAQQLVAAGERVLDVPPTLSARVRLLDAGRTDKTDPHDARSAAVVALRHGGLRKVTAVDHCAVLRLLADRHHDLIAQRTRVICRLHALMCLLIAGGLSRQLTTGKAAAALRAVRPVELVDIERKRMALDLLADVRRLDSQLATVKDRIAVAVEASATTVTNVYGVGPIVAALLVGHTSDVGRFVDCGTLRSLQRDRSD